MKEKHRYAPPHSEILCFMTEDVITASGFSENGGNGSGSSSGSGWNNNGNGNGNGHWFEEKPGQGGHKN